MTGSDTRRRLRGVGVRAASAAAGLCVAALTAACGPSGEPVAALRVPTPEVTLAYPGTAAVETEWRLTAPLGSNEALLFVHLLDGSGEVVRTFDRPLPFEWRVGESREATIDVWQSALGPALAAGEYDLTVGLYEAGGRDRWRLAVEAPEVDEGEYRVARVRVLPPAPGVAVELTGGWQPESPGLDRQVLGRRILVDRGRMELSGLPDTARLALRLRLPGPDEGLRLILEEGERAARVSVSSPCAAAGETVQGAGERVAELLLRPGASGACSVELDASFVAIDPETLTRHSAVLERVVWNPAGERPTP